MFMIGKWGVFLLFRLKLKDFYEGVNGAMLGSKLCAMWCAYIREAPHIKGSIILNEHLSNTSLSFFAHIVLL